jgi:hypothetical protein
MMLAARSRSSLGIGAWRKATAEYQFCVNAHECHYADVTLISEDEAGKINAG